MKGVMRSTRKQEMQRLIYALQFVRPAAGEPIVASSVTVSTVINPGGVTGTIEPLEGFETAVVQTTPTINPDGSFTEKGTVTFGDPAENNILTFSSIGLGYLNAYFCPENPFTAGTVMWTIESGQGFFAGATGAITSNFLIDLSTPGHPGELIAYHFGVVYLP
jgi:hypothetical protein